MKPTEPMQLAPAPIRAARPHPHAGRLSTEFWLSVALVVVGLALIAFGLVLRDALIVAVGAGEQTAAVVGYAYSRGKFKGRPYLPPAGRV
jgi:uncharacterized membrane protein